MIYCTSSCHDISATLSSGVSNISCCLAEKDSPVLVKQEPAEIKDLVAETDKSKSRYKKIISPVPPSPVSRKNE